jgi:hypothetical protein
VRTVAEFRVRVEAGHIQLALALESEVEPTAQRLIAAYPDAYDTGTATIFRVDDEATADHLLRIYLTNRRHGPPRRPQLAEVHHPARRQYPVRAPSRCSIGRAAEPVPSSSSATSAQLAPDSTWLYRAMVIAERWPASLCPAETCPGNIGRCSVYAWSHGCAIDGCR